MKEQITNGKLSLKEEKWQIKLFFERKVAKNVSYTKKRHRKERQNPMERLIFEKTDGKREDGYLKRQIAKRNWYLKIQIAKGIWIIETADCNGKINIWKIRLQKRRWIFEKTDCKEKMNIWKVRLQREYG